nr:MAG TPA: hypothetical protein [Caudoviricetes sp.]
MYKSNSNIHKFYKKICTIYNVFKEISFLHIFLGNINSA